MGGAEPLVEPLEDKKRRGGVRRARSFAAAILLCLVHDGLLFERRVAISEGCDLLHLRVQELLRTGTVHVLLGDEVHPRVDSSPAPSRP